MLQLERGKIAPLPYSPTMVYVLDRAQHEARNLGHGYIGTEHLVLGLLHDEYYEAALKELGITLENARKVVTDFVDNTKGSKGIILLPRTTRTLEYAEKFALERKSQRVDTHDLFHAFFLRDAQNSQIPTIAYTILNKLAPTNFPMPDVPELPEERSVFIRSTIPDTAYNA